MRITAVRYRTNVEVAPYRHEHAEVEVQTQFGETVDEAFAMAKSEARRLLGIDVTEADVEHAKAVIKGANEVLAKAERAKGKVRGQRAFGEPLYPKDYGV